MWTYRPSPSGFTLLSNSKEIFHVRDELEAKQFCDALNSRREFLPGSPGEKLDFELSVWRTRRKRA